MNKLLPIAMILVAALACNNAEKKGNDGDKSKEGDDAADAGDKKGEGEAVNSYYELEYTEERDVCKGRSPLRNLYFGDLHFHSRYSWDAYGYYLTVTPEEAYGFAKGREVYLPPLDENGKGTRKVKIDRPLDFAALTDHAEFFGELSLCITEGSASYDAATCRKFREMNTDAVARWGMQLTATSDPKRFTDVCGEEGDLCLKEAANVWQKIISAAESSYDKSEDCSFTAFIAYEYTGTPKVTNQHRNIIFRNDKVIPLPVSYYEAPAPKELWQKLNEQCFLAESGCDLMVIPHNSNWSNGAMFYPDYPRTTTYEDMQEAAKLRAKIEPVVEIFQHKGDMECENGLSGIEREEDPFCSFEKLRFPPLNDCGDEIGWGGVKDMGCVSRFDFLRFVLLEGFVEKKNTGINPYMLGFIGSTDSHNGTPGNVWERGWPGHVGVSDDLPEKRLGEGNMTHRGRVNNPGGLAAVWAYENSRDAIFEAMRRRETYATSGTRIEARFFGGWDYPQDICNSKELVKTGYDYGVPMGGVLPKKPKGKEAPVFAAFAKADLEGLKNGGANLQVMQIVKGWMDKKGVLREKVYDIAGNRNNGATVGENCEPIGEDFEELCARWVDPQFDPEENAFYYMRIIENPTCRWSSSECDAYEGEKHEGCLDPNIPRTIQERAWTSAIWHSP